MVKWDEQYDDRCLVPDLYFQVKDSSSVNSLNAMRSFPMHACDMIHLPCPLFPLLDSSANSGQRIDQWSRTTSIIIVVGGNSFGLRQGAVGLSLACSLTFVDGTLICSDSSISR